MDRERKKRREENYFCFAGKRKTREFIPAKAQSTTRLAQKNATARTFLGHGGCSEKFTLTKCAGQLKNPGRFHKISNEWCASSLSLSIYPSIHPSIFSSLSLLLGRGPHYENASVKPDISRTRYIRASFEIR